MFGSNCQCQQVYGHCFLTSKYGRFTHLLSVTYLSFDLNIFLSIHKTNYRSLVQSNEVIFFWLLFFFWQGGKSQLLVCPYLRSLTTFAHTREIEMRWLWYIFTPLPKPKCALRQVKIITTGIWYDYWPGLHLLSFPQYWSSVQSSSHVSSCSQVFLSSFCRSWHLPLSDIQSFVDSQYTEIIIDYLQILCKHTFFKFFYC